MKWASGGRVVQQVLQLFVTTVLVRLLVPDDFGLIGMATVVMGFVNLFRDLGTASVIVQRRVIDRTLLSSIYWLNSGFGLMTVTTLVVGAPLLAGIYDEPRLGPMFQVMAFSFLLSSLGVVQHALLMKELRFKQLAVVDVGSISLGGLVGIGFAVSGAGVWSLVAQMVGTAFFSTLLIFSFARWWPSFTFDWSALRSVGGHSAGITGYSITSHFTRNWDYLLLGRAVGATPLGPYVLAYRLMLYPLRNVSAVIGSVLFPVMSRVQDDDERLGRAYLKTVGAISVVSFPIMGGLAAVASEFVPLVFGEQWTDTVVLLWILAPVGIQQSLVQTVRYIYQAKDRTKALVWYGISVSATALVAVIIGLRWGVVGVAYTTLVASMLVVYPAFAIPLRMIGYRFRDAVRVIWPSAMTTAFMIGIVAGTRVLVEDSLVRWLALTVYVLAGIGSYAALSLVFNRDRVLELWRALWSRQTAEQVVS